MCTLFSFLWQYFLYEVHLHFVAESKLKFSLSSVFLPHKEMHTSLIISVPKIEGAPDLKKEKNKQNKKS